MLNETFSVIFKHRELLKNPEIHEKILFLSSISSFEIESLMFYDPKDGASKAFWLLPQVLRHLEKVAHDIWPMYNKKKKLVIAQVC